MVSTALIEECVLQQLPSLFSITSVLEMKDPFIASVAAESSGSVIHRERLVEKMKTLEKSLNSIRRFKTPNLNLDSVSQDPMIVKMHDTKRSIL